MTATATATATRLPGGALGAGPGDATRADAALALRNTATLGGSLVLTWGIALGVRLLMPRFLGPEGFGPVNFADAFTATFFVALGLGIDVYIRKEVAVRPAHASDFFAGVTLVRALGAVALFAVMQAVLVATDRPPEVRALVWVFAVAQLFFSLNQSLAALLHARGTVNELSALNIASKLLWGGLVIATVVLRWPLWGIPGALLASEAVKTAGGLALASRHLGLKWRVDLLAVKAAVLASLPIYVNTVAHTAYNKLDVSIIAVVAGDKEVAWYGASSLLAGMTMLIAPVIGWVLLPLYARARARSEQEYLRVLRRSLELVLVIAFPTTLFMALGADTWVALLYGGEYAPAATSLRILSPLFLLTYVAIVSANALIMSDRAWTMALVSLAGLALNPLLNWAFIPRAMAAFAVGGGGVGAACAQLGTELFVTALMVWLFGRQAFDRRTLATLAKLTAISALTVALDRALAPLGWPRLGLEVAVFCALVLATRALDLREAAAFVRAARRPQP